MTVRVGVVQFPGTNCEQDAVWAFEQVGCTADILWHQRNDLSGFDAVAIAGGFAHGDYLRTGAIAQFSPVMSAIAVAAQDGMPIIGICNGFQILCEAGLLPGALQKNAGLKFMCDVTPLRVESTNSPLTAELAVGDVANIPINHFEGNYTCDDATLAKLRAEDRVVLRYVDNPNGSRDDIAGICSEGRNVVGLMPHPERAAEAILGSADGAPMLRSVTAWLGARV
ncbi:MAG: phosphoribosylformylglycinamidine synthase subunit PurQ [Acidimicrobiia bacterium]